MDETKWFMLSRPFYCNHEIHRRIGNPIRPTCKDRISKQNACISRIVDDFPPHSCTRLNISRTWNAFLLVFKMPVQCHSHAYGAYQTNKLHLLKPGKRLVPSIEASDVPHRP